MANHQQENDQHRNVYERSGAYPVEIVEEVWEPDGQTISRGNHVDVAHQARKRRPHEISKWENANKVHVAVFEMARLREKNVVNQAQQRRYGVDGQVLERPHGVVVDHSKDSRRKQDPEDDEGQHYVDRAYHLEACEIARLSGLPFTKADRRAHREHDKQDYGENVALHRVISERPAAKAAGEE